MRILDRYIFKSILSVFIGCIILFMFLYIIIDIFSHLDDILKYKTDLTTLMRYYREFLPVIFVQIAPFACLLAVLYALSGLNRHNEIIAMRTCGLSIWHITKTALAFGIVISAFIFLLNENLVITAQVRLKKIQAQMLSKAPTKHAKQEEIRNLSMYGLRNRLFFVNRFYVKDNALEGITILEQDQQQNVTKKIVASAGRWEDGLWTFYDCITYEFDRDGQIKGEPTYFKAEIMSITETPKDFLNQIQMPEFMSISQLNDYIYKLSRSSATSLVRSLRVDLYKRFTEPLTSFIIIIIGIPFALKIKKRVTALASFGVCLIVSFLYYVSTAVSIAFGKAGFLPPALAVSLSHILFFFLGILLIYDLS